MAVRLVSKLILLSFKDGREGVDKARDRRVADDVACLLVRTNDERIPRARTQVANPLPQEKELEPEAS